ncbi:MAG: shikimate kinase, partial [Halieaceae bacterium]|nr:shikimate kinase [Halieaceae bacterium]
MASTTISLIGMPGAGKSSIGVILAKRCGLRFVDTDLDLQVRAGATLQEILERDGFQRLRQLEHEVLLAIDLAGAVIATGGSVVYSADAMRRLRAAGPVAYLRADL